MSRPPRLDFGSKGQAIAEVVRLRGLLATAEQETRDAREVARELAGALAYWLPTGPGGHSTPEKRTRRDTDAAALDRARALGLAP